MVVLLRSFVFLFLCLGLFLGSKSVLAGEEVPKPTRRFEVRGDRLFLGGQPIDLWGIRSSNAPLDDAITERHIRNFDNFIAHGINCLGCYIQGGNGGWPDVNAGPNGYTPKTH